MGIIRTGTLYGLIGIGILTIMGILIAKGITLPVVNLVRITKKIGEGDLDIRIKTDSNDEIGELASAFNKMTQDLKNTIVSKEYVDNIIKNMMDPLIVIDYYGKIKMVNRAFSEVLGYLQREIIDKPISIILAEKDSKALTEKKEIKDYETYFKAKDSRTIPVLFSKSIMKDKNGLMICAICTAKDITERIMIVEAERQLEEQRARAILSERLSALGEMATGMAHELNQPLSGVRGLAEHILIGSDRGWDLSKKTIRENVQMIIEQTERMTHVIEHTRRFARGVESPDLLPVQINDVIRSAQDLIMFQLQYRGLKLKCDLTEGLPVILANPFSLEEVILNLINNARDALLEQKKNRHSKNSKEIIIRTFHGLKDPRGDMMVQVIDHGAGIPQDLMPKVFDPFFTTKDPDKGTGLGLAISKSIIEEFRGTISINSVPGHGTTVTIILPAMT